MAFFLIFVQRQRVSCYDHKGALISLSSCMHPRSHYTHYMRLGLTERRNKASCLIGIGQRDSLRHPRYVDQPHRSYKGLSILYRDSMEIYVDTTQA
jgi:hypothetical protein